MPLRIRKPRLQQSLPSIHIPTAQCPCAQKSRSRPFSTTQHHATKSIMREEMFLWLNGPGAVYKDPLPGSTNYLSAYDRDGKLLRTKDKSGSSESDSADDENQYFEGSESMERNRGDRTPVSIPPETPDDLMPFPENRQFRSQPVLSEELKDEIWHQVVELKESVRTVSMNLNVEMNRVGAVVRLKTIEKQWIEQVSRVLLSFTVLLMAFYVMRNNSIGLKDNNTGYHINYNSLITRIPTLLLYKKSA